jgi:hypothetical protein
MVTLRRDEPGGFISLLARRRRRSMVTLRRDEPDEPGGFVSLLARRRRRSMVTLRRDEPGGFVSLLAPPSS